MAVEKDWYKAWGIPIKFSRTPGAVRSLPPKFGAHGREILEAHGFAPDEIQALVEAGVLVEERRKAK